MLENYDSFYYLGKAVAWTAATYAVAQALIFLGTADGLSEDDKFSKKYFAKNLLKDTNNTIGRIWFYGARRAAELML